MNRPKAIDLFSGAGGMSLGFEQAGFDIVASVELDPIHSAVHKYNFPHTVTICGDVSKLTGAELLESVSLEHGQLDVVFGGPPCQGVSLMGKRLIDDDRNALIGHFARIVKETKPRYFVMENVKGLTIGKAKAILEEFIRELQEDGYNVLPYQVLNASQYGVPQDRNRVFVIGYRSDVKPPVYPEPLTVKRGKRGIEGMQESTIPWCPSIDEAIGDLPNIDEFPDLLDSDSVLHEVKPQSNYAAYLHGDAVDKNDYSYPRIWNPNLLTSSLRTEHTELSRSRFAQTSGGEVEPVSRFFRLHVEGISNTLRAGTDSKRGAYTSPRPIHPVYNRCISVREAARIHSFPDWFRFHVTKWHGFREVGNSVPPLLARAVAGQLVKAMEIKLEKPQEPLLLGSEDLLQMDMSAAADYFNVPRNVIGTRDRKDTQEVQEPVTIGS